MCSRPSLDIDCSRRVRDTILGHVYEQVSSLQLLLPVRRESDMSIVVIDLTQIAAPDIAVSVSAHLKTGRPRDNPEKAQAQAQASGPSIPFPCQHGTDNNTYRSSYLVNLRALRRDEVSGAWGCKKL